jgi:hypothetical protein
MPMSLRYPGPRRRSASKNAVTAPAQDPILLTTDDTNADVFSFARELAEEHRERLARLIGEPADDVQEDCLERILMLATPERDFDKLLAMLEANFDELDLEHLQLCTIECERSARCLETWFDECEIATRKFNGLCFIDLAPMPSTALLAGADGKPDPRRTGGTVQAANAAYMPLPRAGKVSLPDARLPPLSCRRPRLWSGKTITRSRRSPNLVAPSLVPGAVCADEEVRPCQGRLIPPEREERRPSLLAEQAR